MLFDFARCSFSKINAVFKSLWGKKLTDYVNVVEMLKRFESGFLVKQAKTFTPQEVRLNFKKMLKFFFQYSSFVYQGLNSRPFSRESWLVFKLLTKSQGIMLVLQFFIRIDSIYANKKLFKFIKT